MRIKFITALTFVTTLTLTGCGGSGGGGGADIFDLDNPLVEQAPAPEAEQAVDGSVVGAAFSKADSDTNDPAHVRISNDTGEASQQLPSHFRVGGYVNKSGTGADGPSKVVGDKLDIFRSNLVKGQALNLFIGDTGEGDLDLYLVHAETGELVNFSVSESGNVESVLVPFAGTYFLVVEAFSGFGNYVLASGNAPIAAEPAQPSADFKLGEVIVVPEPSAKTSGAAVVKDLKNLGLDRLKGLDGQPQLFTLSQLAVSKAKAMAGDTLPTWIKIPADLSGKLATLMAIKDIARRPGVAYAEPNLIRRTMRVPDDLAYRTQAWHYEQIGLPQAWDVTVGSPDVLVAVLDTGVLVKHPDLIANLDPNDPNGFDFISDSESARDGDGRDGNADDPGDADKGQSSFHGTHVAGTIAAVGNNNFGVTGVTWNSRIMPLRVLGLNGGESFDILTAIRYAAGLPNDSNQVPVKPASIINMSLGGFFFSQAEQDAIAEARARGVIVIAAAGNDGDAFFPSALSFPASYEGVVSVGATNILRERAFYSQFNLAVDVCAPGGEQGTDVNRDGNSDLVFSTHGDDSSRSGQTAMTFNGQQGTSMATPHVAGVAALMKSVFPALTPEQFDQLLSTGQLTDDLGPAGRDPDFGFGLINARKAVLAAQRLAGIMPPQPATPTLVAEPAGLSFGFGGQDLDLLLSNGGPGTLSITSVTENANWLTITPFNVDANGIGTYRLRANRTGLPAGPHQATVTVVSSANTLSIPVFVEVPFPEFVTETDVGRLHLYLHDAATDQLVAQTKAAAEDGKYSFAFVPVPNGRYYIVATTDRDNDGLICDASEACGRYPADLGSFTLSGSGLSGFSFSATYDQSVQADTTP